MGDSKAESAAETQSHDNDAAQLKAGSSSRRVLLCGVAVGVSAAALAACGLNEPEKPAASGDVLAKVSDIPVGQGVVGGGVVVVQPSKGKFVAFDAACPHQGTQLPKPVEGKITCPAHGSTFKADDGSLEKGPAETGLSKVKVKVTDGKVMKA